MDKFKEYLLHYKADLDVDSPSEDTWQQVEAKLPAASGSVGETPGSSLPAKTRISMVRYTVAACLIALAGFGLWLVVKSKSPNPNTTTNSNSANPKTAPNSIANAPATTPNVARNNEQPEPTNQTNTKKLDLRRSKPKPKAPAGEVELIDKSYATLINHQLKKLRSTPLYAENSNYFSFYVEQFKQMDHDEQTVRNDIKAYGLTNEFLEQLINVYQQKLNLLKNLQTEVNKMNNKVREKQAPPGKSEVHYLNI